MGNRMHYLLRERQRKRLDDIKAAAGEDEPPASSGRTMSSAIQQLLDSREQLSKLSTWLADNSYLTVQEVADHLGISRDQVDGLPRELLPWTDVSSPGSKRRSKRFRPTDVAAYPAVRRSFEQAKEADEEDEWLAARREELANRDDRLIRTALGRQLEEVA